MNPVSLLMFASLTVVVACTDGDDYDPLQFSVAGDRMTAVGEIDSRSPDAFEDALADHPGVTTLVLRNIGGSVDDEANIELSLMVKSLGLTTLVPSDGLVASGGTDLFLAGKTRILEPGACVGVHAWAADDFSATDIPRTSEEHDPYLDYYRAIGIDPALYWFTLEAAPADSMHWMTSDEAEQYRVSTTPARALSASATCNSR